LWNASLHSGVTPGALVLLMHLTYLATRPKSSEKMRADFREMLLTSSAPLDRLLSVGGDQADRETTRTT
jgi:hypothetical protein